MLGCHDIRAHSISSQRWWVCIRMVLNTLGSQANSPRNKMVARYWMTWPKMQCSYIACLRMSGHGYHPVQLSTKAPISVMTLSFLYSSLATISISFLKARYCPLYMYKFDSSAVQHCAFNPSNTQYLNLLSSNKGLAMG